MTNPKLVLYPLKFHSATHMLEMLQYSKFCDPASQELTGHLRLLVWGARILLAQSCAMIPLLMHFFAIHIKALAWCQWYWLSNSTFVCIYRLLDMEEIKKKNCIIFVYFWAHLFCKFEHSEIQKLTFNYFWILSDSKILCVLNCNKSDNLNFCMSERGDLQKVGLSQKMPAKIYTTLVITKTHAMSYFFMGCIYLTISNSATQQHSHTVTLSHSHTATQLGSHKACATKQHSITATQ